VEVAVEAEVVEAEAAVEGTAHKAGLLTVEFVHLFQYDDCFILFW
jgi:hypothetical protein